MTKRIGFLPRVCEQRAPLIVLLIKVLLQSQTLGATSPCMGKFRLQTERYCRKDLGTTTLNPLPIRVTSRGIKKSWCEDESFRGTKSEFQAAPQVPATLSAPQCNFFRGIRKSWCEDESSRGTKSEFQAAPQVPLPIRVTFLRYKDITVES